MRQYMPRKELLDEIRERVRDLETWELHTVCCFLDYLARYDRDELQRIARRKAQQKKEREARDRGKQ